MSFDLSNASPQAVFDELVYAPPAVMRALVLGFAAAAENLDYIVEHGTYPEKYWDEVQAVADEYDYEFVHPKYTKGPKLVETKPTVH